MELKRKRMPLVPAQRAKYVKSGSLRTSSLSLQLCNDVEPQRLELEVTEK